jgi:glyoxylase-like metal-dependent hydrolase (beta-lactamase superfamily II)
MPLNRELGRGERVLPGLWRLRLPLPWPGIPHGNAWAIAAGSGIVLVDCGYHEAGSLAQLERALAMVNLRLEQVRLLVVTHAHTDHWGEAATVVQRAGCEMWMHPDSAHGRTRLEDPGQGLARRLEIGRQSGVSEQALAMYAEQAKHSPSGLSGDVPADRHLLDGVAVETDLGTWTVLETPGHAPSHVCLHQPERRLLISGDHVIGRVSPYFEYGWSPDPVGEFLHSLDRVEALDVRLTLSGHGKPFTDLRGHVTGNRTWVHERLAACRAALGTEPQTVLELIPTVYGQGANAENGQFLITMTLNLLTHLDRTGAARRERDGDVERWVAA